MIEKMSSTTLPDQNHAWDNLYKFSISRDDYLNLGEDKAAYLGLVNHAATELNVLARLAILSEHDHSWNRIAQLASICQRSVIIRILSSKLFEFFKELRKISSSEIIDPVVKTLSVSAVSSFDELALSRAFHAVSRVRDETTNHYSFKALKKNLKHIGPDPDLDLYMTESIGNSFSLMGEEVSFTARLNRQYHSVPDEELADGAMGEWHDWNIKAGKWVHAVYSDTNLTILSDLISQRSIEKMSIEIPQELVSGSRSFLPIIWEAEKDP